MVGAILHSGALHQPTLTTSLGVARLTSER